MVPFYSLGNADQEVKITELSKMASKAHFVLCLVKGCFIIALTSLFGQIKYTMNLTLQVEDHGAL